MYEIDFTTCTPADVIERSYILHPSLFAEALRDAAQVHIDFCNVTANPQAKQAARKMAWSLCDMAREIDRGLFSAEILDCTRTVQALHVAAKLQCLPRHLVSDIAGRYKPA
jgi:hypothetical protein